MRAGTLPRTIPIIMIFVLSVLMVGTFCFSTLLARGEDTSVYLEADMDIPSTVQYTGSAVNFSFTLWKSTDQKVSWTSDEESAHISNFSVKYYNASNVLISAPSAVGSYTARVVATGAISGHKNSAGYFITSSSVICDKKFSIVYEQVSAVYGALEGKDCLLLGAVTDWYGDIVGGTKVYIGGNQYPTGGGTDCTVEVQYYSGAWSNTATVASIGSYRVVLTFLQPADFADSIAPVTCGSVMYRYFEVKSEGITLSLAGSSNYIDDSPVAKLSSNSVSALAAAGISYNTTLYVKETATSGVVTLREVQTASGAGEFSATEVGSYIYRVSFNGDYSAYGISTGDYYDLAYTIQALPYYVLYYINTDGQNLDDSLQYTVHNTSGYTVEILPIFYNSNGSRLSSVYNTSDGSKKYTVTYKMYNELYADPWVDLATLSMTKPQAVGRYRVIITFASPATVNSGYIIEQDTVINYEFEIVNNPLQVTPLSGVINYYTGSAVIPALEFTHTSGTVTSAVSGKYIINYYQLDGTLIGTTAPSAAGEYQGEVVFTEDIPSLSIEAGYVTRFYYKVRYGALAASFVCGAGANAVITFTSGVSGQSVSLTEGVDYTVTYYGKDGTIYAHLPEAPSAAGNYRAQITYLNSLDLYNIATSDITYYDYSISSNAAWVSYSTSLINLEYDGGYKVAAYSFFVGSTAVALTELVDYKITYYKYNAATELYDIITDYPRYAGKYRQIITFLKTDINKHITAGVTSSYTYTIATCSVQIAYAAETALVYDNTAKGFTATMIKGNRPFNATYSIYYAANVGGTPVFDLTEKITAGSYLAELRLDDTEQSSLVLSGNAWSFIIAKLSLNVTFDVPVGADAMFVDSSTSVMPTVTYSAINGIYSTEPAASDSAVWAARGINIGAVTSYYTSMDGVAYNVEATPEIPNNYQIVIQCGNSDNIIFSGAVSVCDNDQISLPIASIKDGKAVTVYTVYSRLVQAKVEFSGSLYYNGEQKGVEGVSFYAYNSATEQYDMNVSSVFGSDYTIYYYTSDYSGNVSSIGTTTPPTIKSYYVARIILNDFDEGSAPQYVLDKYYSFAGGKDGNGVSLEGGAIASGSYVDFIFRIRDQEKLDVIFDMPASFAADGNTKEISVTYFNHLETVLFTKGADYEILYYNSEGESSPVGYSEVGTYQVRIYFPIENTMYRFNNYPGTYHTDYSDDLYITAGDYIEYEYIIFPPYSMQVTFNAPSSLYYTGSAKAYSASFTVSVGSEVSNVVLTYGTHYKLVYYAKGSNALYSQLSTAPTAPNEYGYAVEVVFLCDLLDYSIAVDGEDKIITVSEFTTIAQCGGVIGNAVTPNCTFEIAKAVLTVSGISAANKQFDNTTAVTLSGTPVFNIKIDEYGKAMGAKVIAGGSFIYTAQGTVAGEFISCKPSNNVMVNLTSRYYLSGDGANYYTLEYADISANITKRTVLVTPQGIAREYNPFAVESAINYTSNAGDEVLTSLLGALPENLFVGALSRIPGTSVGSYPISLGTLTLDDSLSTDLVIEGETTTLSDLFIISLVSSNYRITRRQVTITLLAGQSKIYGAADPSLQMSITSGSLIYNDKLVGTPLRAAGENVGVYAVSLGGIKICDSQDVDVSSNYSITLASNSFQIAKKPIRIAAVNQENVLYTTGFNNKLVNVLYGATNVTESFVTNPTGDRVSGVLSLQETDNYLVYTIMQGSITIVNSSGKNVSKNYDISFYTGTYSIQKVVVNVRITDSPTLTKYFGDADPIIGFTVLNGAVLGAKYTITAVSSVGRVSGEDAGEYRLLSNNDNASFVVKSSGKDVSKYFDFNVSGIAAGTRFRIMPRPIIVTVADMKIENTGRTIIPTVRYLNSDGSSLSRSIVEKLKVNFTVSSNIKYKEGKNSVPPIISGEVSQDSNFVITIREGIITVTYLQNIVTAEAVEADADIYAENKYVLAGFMLYKTVKIYKLSTANGASPSHDVQISLPITDDITGKQLVAVAMYSNSKTGAFQLYDAGDYLVYSDGDAYYVALSTAEEWFYIIWGVVIIVGGVAIYFLTVLTIKIVKKIKIKRIATAPQRAIKKAEKAKLRGEKAAVKGDKVRAKTHSTARRKGGFVPSFIKRKSDVAADEIGPLPSSDMLSESPEVSEKPATVAHSSEKVKIKNANSSKKPKGFMPVSSTKPVGKKGKNKVSTVSTIDEDAAIAAMDMFADSNSAINSASEKAKGKVGDKAQSKKAKAVTSANDVKKGNNKSSSSKKKGAYKPKGFVPSAANKPKPMFDDIPTAMPSSMVESNLSEIRDLEVASTQDMFADTNTSFDKGINLEALKNNHGEEHAQDEIIVSNNTFFDDEEEQKETDEDRDMY